LGGIALRVGVGCDVDGGAGVNYIRCSGVVRWHHWLVWCFVWFLQMLMNSGHLRYRSEVLRCKAKGEDQFKGTVLIGIVPWLRCSAVFVAFSLEDVIADPKVQSRSNGSYKE